MNARTLHILPSLLAADYGHLAAACRLAEVSGADALHLDLMDGHFVPNISFGPDMVAMARRNCRLPLNVHLMFTHPDRYAARVIAAGADTVLFHVEVDRPISDLLETIRAAGVRRSIQPRPPRPSFPISPAAARSCA
jgi:ribulose-phosphate 3-epimerase